MMLRLWYLDSRIFNAFNKGSVNTGLFLLNIANFSST